MGQYDPEVIFVMTFADFTIVSSFKGLPNKSASVVLCGRDAENKWSETPFYLAVS